MNPIAWLNPARWMLYAALLAALALGAWTLERHVEGVGYAKAQAEYTALALKSEQAARAKEQEYQDQLKRANDEHKKREAALAAAADGARAQSDRLRGDIASIRRQLPGLAEAAVRRYADTASAVLDDCQRAYSDMAKVADGLDNDKRALIEAWPK